MALHAPRSHTPKGALSRTTILAAAERVLVLRGFHGTSMRDIAEAAGLPLASVVYHFAKKEQLYAAVLVDIGDELTASLAIALASDERTWPARLDALARSLVAWTTTRPGRVKLLLRELLDNPARVAKAERLPLAPVLHRMSEFVEGGMRAGAFRQGEPETSVLHLVGAVSYVVAARPTVRRIVGPARDRELALSYEREAIRFARLVFLALDPEELPYGSKQASVSGQTSSRARRGKDDRRGSAARSNDAPRRHVPR